MKALAEMIAAAGLTHPSKLRATPYRPAGVAQRRAPRDVTPLTFLKAGELLAGRATETFPTGVRDLVAKGQGGGFSGCLVLGRNKRLWGVKGIGTPYEPYDAAWLDISPSLRRSHVEV